MGELTDKEREKVIAAIEAAKEKVTIAKENLIEAAKAFKQSVNHPDFLGNPPTAITREIDLCNAIEANIINYVRNSAPNGAVTGMDFNQATNALLG